MALAVRKQFNGNQDSMLNKLPVLEAAAWVDVIVSSIKQSSLENRVNGVEKTKANKFESRMVEGL